MSPGRKAGLNQMQLTSHFLGFGTLPIDTMSPKDKKFITGMQESGKF